MKLLPANRWARALVYLALLVAYSAAMWFLVFPWVDQRYVNRPGFDERVVEPTGTPTGAPSVVPSR